MSESKMFRIRTPANLKIPKVFGEEKKQKSWKVLNTAIDRIFRKEQSDLKYEELYRAAYDLVMHRQHQFLSDQVRDRIQRHLETIVPVVRPVPDGKLLDVLFEIWEEYFTGASHVADTMLYLDKTYFRKFTPTIDFGVSQFYKSVVSHPEVFPRLRQLLFEEVQRERDGELVNRDLLKSLFMMFIMAGSHTEFQGAHPVRIKDPSLYRTVIEKDLFAQTVVYFRQERSRLLAVCSVPEYLRKISVRLDQERDRARCLLDSSSEEGLMEIVKNVLICEIAQSLVENETSGCLAMMQAEMLEELHLMYHMFSLVPPTLVMIRKLLSRYCCSLSEEIVTDNEAAKDPAGMVNRLIAVREHADKIVTVSFSGDHDMIMAMRKGFEESVNKGTRCATCLAIFCDRMIKDKKMTTDALEVEFDKAVTLYRYLEDKDLFALHYCHMMMKRLLSGRTLNEEAETLMISKLKVESGPHMTKGMEGLIRDIQTSAETMKVYADRITSPLPIEFDVAVLQQNHYRGAYPCSPQFPPEMKLAIDSFTTFYTDKFQGRKIVFVPELGQVVVRAQFSSGMKLLVVSVLQALLLELFNGKKQEITAEELCTELSIGFEALRRHLLSLTTPKARILLKKPNIKILHPSDVLSVNEGFKSKHYRIIVPMIKSSTQMHVPKDDVPKEVDDSRRFQIDAAVVRILKTKRRIGHNQLMIDVVKHLQGKFKPQMSVVKQRIENLIERDYLKRGEDRKSYEYIA